jgi:hypothetical protein
VRTDVSHRRAKIVRDWSENVEASDRFVDIGVTLRIVKAAPRGEVLIEGGRPMVILDEKCFGGIVDTKADPPRIVPGDDGISQNPQVWLCSEDQWAIIRHADDEPVGKLALGGMGAGKTTAGVIWTYLRWLENLGSRNEMGVTAPTETRLSLVFNEMFKMFPSSWWRYNSETKILTMCDAFRIRGVSTHRQSASQGSRLQAFNWVGLLDDEGQDSIDEFIHKMARLRSKTDGRAKRLMTATAKDFPEWRTLKDSMIESGVWQLHSLLGPNSPFIHPQHWDAMKRSMTERDYRRLVLAEDLPPESRLYSTFDRKENLRPIPNNARKITSIVIGRKTGDRRDALLMGHDPGAAKAGTVWLDAYEIPQRKGEVLWWVRHELFTVNRTHEEHATQAMRETREKFGTNYRDDAERAHVRCQPLGQAEDKPDLDVMKIWRRIGFDIRFAKYTDKGVGKGQIKKEARIGMINMLWCDATGRRRLFIECDDRGRSACPLLLTAIESMERDAMGRPERDEKDVAHDRSDLPAALGYALWFCESESSAVLRADIRRSL